MIPNNPLENLMNTFGTLLRVHPFVPVNLTSQLNQNDSTIEQRPVDPGLFVGI